MRIRTHDYSNIRENNPWWDTQCENVKRDKLHALNKSRSFPSPLNLAEYKYQRCRLKNIVKEKKHIYSESQKRKLLESRNDPKTFWKNVKNIRNRSINANKISLDSWFEHFKSLLQVPQQDNLQDFQYEEPLKKDIFDAPISEEEVKNNI